MFAHAKLIIRVTMWILFLHYDYIYIACKFGCANNISYAQMKCSKCGHIILLCNVIPVMPSYRAKSHYFFHAHQRIYLVNAFSLWFMHVFPLDKNLTAYVFFFMHMLRIYLHLGGFLCDISKCA